MRKDFRWPVMCLLFVGLYACGEADTQQQETNREVVVRDTTITKTVAVTKLFLDSLTVDSFVHKFGLQEYRAEQLRNFYNARNYQFAWFTENGLAQQARAFWNLHNNFVNYSRDSSLHDAILHQQMKLLMDDEDQIMLTKELARDIELKLTEHFFDYAQYAYAGRIEPDQINWHIPRKKINAIALLDSLIQRNGQDLDEWEPLNSQYKALRTELLRLYAIQKDGGWATVTANNKAYRKGDTAEILKQLKERLFLTGDYQAKDWSAYFSKELDEAIKRVQKRLGLGPDGVLGAQTLKALNVPVETRIEQVLVNMERMRWMPEGRGDTVLVANIPEFKLHVLEGGKEVFNMRIVVGKAASKTVIFNDRLKQVVFSPYWNVPSSIVEHEILPAMKRSPAYLTKNNMEKVGTSNGLPIIRQKPGAGNALGRVKFLFPNSYNIYFHDTPSKSLFGQSSRAFSHGCIRLEEPAKLAAYLLKSKKEWTEEKIREAMNSEDEKWVVLDAPVPVVISYFTAWVDQDGLLHFRDDIYGHDRELADRLFKR